jgi:hypothetical protein
LRRRRTWLPDCDVLVVSGDGVSQRPFGKVDISDNGASGAVLEGCS